MPRDCLIGQNYIRSGKLIFDRGFYHWPNGVHVQGHPWGLKASVDVALQSQARALMVQEGTAVYYRVEPVGEVEEEGESPEVALEEAKGAYPAIISVATGAVESPQHVPSEMNKKAAQFQLETKPVVSCSILL